MIKLEKCNCLYKVNLPADELNVFRVITDINILKGSFIMEYPSYTQEYLESILIEDIKNNDIGKIKGILILDLNFINHLI